jgi:hypothetical protein
MSTLPAILKRSEEAGHTVFKNGSYNLNLIGVRTESRLANKFDDWFHVVFKDDSGSWIDLSFECTTDPGTYWLEKPMNSNGTAILKAGQYRGVWKVDLHRGKYKALCQRNGKVTVYRDNDRNNTLDLSIDTIDEGWFGINIHKAGNDSTQVNRWSAGCQVIANDAEFEILMSLVYKSIEKYGDGFSYTLLED